MKNQLKGGVLLSYMSIFANNIIGLLYTPFMVRSLGPSEYGMYSLAASTVGYLMIMDLGFGNAITRFTIKFRLEKKNEREATLHGMFILIYFIIGILVAFAGVFFAYYSPLFFSDAMSFEEIRRLKILILLLTINLSVTFFFSTYRAIIIAYEKFVFMKTLDLVRTILNPLIMIPLLMHGYKSVSLVVVLTIVNVFVLTSSFYYYKKYIDVKPIFGFINWQLFYEVFGYSSLILLGSVVDQIYWNSGHFILGTVASTASVAVYSIAITIKNLYFSFSTAIVNVFLPKVTKLVVSTNSTTEISDLFVKIGRLQFLIISLALSSFILFGRRFIHFWVGDDYADSYLITLLIIIPVTVPLIQNIGILILQANNKLKFRSFSYFVIAIINLAIAIPLAKTYEGTGVALATSVSLFIGNGVVMNVYYWREIKLDIVRFWKEIMKISVPIIISMLFYLTVKLMISIEDTFPIFIIEVMLFMFMMVSLLWFFGMNRYEKEILYNMFFRIIGKSKFIIKR